MAVTIKDIAKRLKISTSTVSRALNRKPGISPVTISTVNLMAKKMNYRPNTLAISLRQHKSNCIGVILPSVASYFFSEAVAGIQEQASKYNYQVLLLQTADNEAEEKKAIAEMNAGRVDGVLLSIGSEVKSMRHIRALRKEMPVVLFDRVTKKLNFPSVGAEDFNGAYQMTKYLIRSGRKRIIHLTGRRNLDIVQDRLLGYKKALADHMITYRKNFVVDCGFDKNKAALAVIKLVASGLSFDAIFAANDRMAIQAILTLKGIGYDVPKNVAVAGFGNYPTSEIVHPQLTTVNHKAKEVGERATKALIDLIEDDSNFVRERINADLVLRDSA